MGDSPALKKPKLEKDDYDSAYWPRPSSNGPAPKPPASAAGPSEEEDIAEEAVFALIAHRERDVERCKLKLLHHQSLLDTAEKKLAEAQSRLARYRDRAPDRKPPPPRQRDPKPPPPPSQREPKPPPPDQKAPVPAPQPAVRPQLVIPGANTRPSAPRPAPRPEPMPGLKKAAAPSSSSSPAPPERLRTEDKKPKRKIEQKEHQNLIQSVRKSSATVLRFHGGTVVSSQHKRKLRCLELCPANDQLVVTSALDGLITLWQVQPKGAHIGSYCS